jgi:hypothetical protein
VGRVRDLHRFVGQTATGVRASFEQPPPGYGLGGLLLAVLTPRHALLITAATFLASAALLRLGTRHRPARVQVRERRGTRQLLADRRIRLLLLLFWIPAMFAVVPEAPAAPSADALGAGSPGLGLLMCALPVGTVAGELFAGARLGPAARERIALPLVCLPLLPYLGYALHPSLAVSLLLLLAAGAGSAYTLGLDQWFVRAVPEELRGRAMTVLSAGLMTIQGVGMTLAGVAAEVVGVRVAVAGAGAVGRCAAAAWWRPPGGRSGRRRSKPDRKPRHS